MKLLTYTSRIQLLYFLMLFGIFSILFYLVLSWNVLQNVDEVLYNRKVNLLAYLEQNPEAPFKEDNPLDDFTFYLVEEAAFQERYESYTDTLIYEPVDDEFDEYRMLNTFVRLHGKHYRLEIIKPHLEAAEMIGTIAITLGSLFLALLLSFYVSQRVISRKIWGPFFEILEKLRLFRFDKQEFPALPSTHIDEFRMLNEAVNELTRKNMEVFESQKQFIENASHEMQTPLSVIQSRLEGLIGQAELTQEQAEIVEGIIGSTQRLKKLNKTLLLLSKIENRQFLLSEQVDINTIISRSMEYYEEQKAALNISVKTEIQNNLIVQGNTMLAEILVQNLLKNAFLHNRENGTVNIQTKERKFMIANTGHEKQETGTVLEKDKLFSRFYKQSGNPDTWGLGLAIARKIADTSGWELHYREEEGLHIFEVDFG
ncbi:MULTISPECIES: sensor histidine kinase [Cytophagales]|uniref:histidine kinase n=3 Tax=Cytophagales TaxID=768507 RepID=A0ABQ1N533_9BACT|nr:HAMP domain-containing sensor histidine kinase [Echinicola rosea]GGC54323.1 two-component sensor histidine kinase [Marivirga lumbricoides]GGF38359.1 two-component sensor histidine kinase [Echinicola rosea]|tara:strand:- start:16244 stop:17527 length:1284 start_codon:yes stop_codon:yes gene_type:complete